MTQIRIARVYDPPSPDDGYRVLVDRLWPRGVAKRNLPYDRWAKELAPSTELRRWYHADPESRRAEFAKRYREELRRSAAIAGELDALASHDRVTLLYASKDEKGNHALVLQKFLKEKLR